MSSKEEISRRNFFGMTAAASAGALAMSNSPARAAEGGTADSVKKDQKELPALPQIRLLADTFVRWQMDTGRLDPRRTSCANWSSKRNSYKPLVIGLNQAHRATGTEAYRSAADRMAVFYLSCLCNTANWHPPHFGIGMSMYRELKRNHPQVADFDHKAAALFEWMKDFQWDEGSYYRNGYPGGKMADAANSCDNADAGDGLTAYYAVKKRPEVLAAAEQLARYFLTEVKPGTYQGVWSSKLGTWVVAPTTQDHFEHFKNVKACEIAWGYTSIISINYLTCLAKATDKKDVQSSIAEKCAASMKWQFDACQFDDGACGMSGRDDKWGGMTAGAILSYLRTRDAGYLSEDDVARYRPKAQAARDWLLRSISAENLQSRSAGYFPVHGKSLPSPADNVAWMLAYTLQALLRIQNI